MKLVHGMAHHGVLGTTVKSTMEQYVEMVSSFERKNTVCVGIMMCKGTVMSVVSPQLMWKAAISYAQVTAITAMYKLATATYILVGYNENEHIAVSILTVDYLIITLIT